MDRRQFIGGAAAALGTMALGVMAGCSAQTTQGASGDSETSRAPYASEGANPSSAPAVAETGAPIKTDNSTPGGSLVYATSDLSSEGLLACYEALGFSPVAPVAIKLHMARRT